MNLLRIYNEWKRYHFSVGWRTVYVPDCSFPSDMIKTLFKCLLHFASVHQLISMKIHLTKINFFQAIKPAAHLTEPLAEHNLLVPHSSADETPYAGHFGPHVTFSEFDTSV